MEKCPLCKAFIQNASRHNLTFYIDCRTCGCYQITHEATITIEGEIGHNKYLLSGLTREASEENSSVLIKSSLLKEMAVEALKRKPPPLEAITVMLRYIYKKTSSPIAEVKILPQHDYTLIYAKTPDELKWVITKLSELGYIESENTIRLTVKGWEKLVEIGNSQKRTNQAFVAMWFHDSTKEAYELGIKTALESVGYNPVRIDRVEHIEKICDRIIAEIRKSGLLVADFTGHRGGVYFEAGFAMGLGIPVIWTCRETDINNAHFDTRQYNHIIWSNPEELRDKIIHRIQATIPHPVKI